MTDLKLSIIIPCYNEEAVISQTYERLKRVLDADGALADHEILFIDDGSSDGTLGLLKGIIQRDPRARAISFSRNFGQQAAMAAGIENCTGDAAVILDADQQHPPELIPEMVATYRNSDCDVVYAVRRRRRGESLMRRAAGRAFSRFMNYLSDTHHQVDSGEFRLMDRKVIEAFKSLPETKKFVRGLLSWVGFKQCPVYYECEPRAAGETKYNLRSLVRLAGVATVYFSAKPLRLALTLGFLSLTFSLLLVADVLISKFSNPTLAVPGWASISLSIVFFGSVQLLTIGVLGEYVANMFDEVKHRPQYIVAERMNLE